jgi:hypothetical protein
MAKPKTYVLQLHFNSEKDLIEWSEGTTKRPYNVKKEDGSYIENCKLHTKKKYCVESFKDEDAPEFKDLHSVAQGLRLGELLR